MAVVSSCREMLV